MLTYPGLVPLAARDEINTIVEASFQTITIDTVDHTIGELVIVIAHTLYRVAVIEPAWSADDFHAIVDDLITQVIDRSYARLNDSVQVVFLGGPDVAASEVETQVIIEGTSTRTMLVPRRKNTRPPREAFTTRQRSALETSPAWTRYQALARRLVTPAVVTPIPSADPRPPLTIKQAAKKLSVSGSTIERMIARKEIHAATVGTQKRIPVSEVDRLLALPKYQFPDR